MAWYIYNPPNCANHVFQKPTSVDNTEYRYIWTEYGLLECIRVEFCTFRGYMGLYGHVWAMEIAQPSWRRYFLLKTLYMSLKTPIERMATHVLRIGIKSPSLQ